MTDRTTVAVLTPPGTAAIATIVVVGAGAWNATRKLFRPIGAPLPEQPRPGLLRVGRLGEGAGDEVVLAVRRTEPMPWIEVHCHGGRQVVAMLLEQFRQLGCTLTDWRELPTESGRRLDQELLDGLTHAPTVRTASILLDQLNGALVRALTEIRTALEISNPAAAERRLGELLRYAPLGRHLIEPWRVVIAGPPNVGKSSLINALAGYRRSVVAPLAGTTRDVVTTSLAFDGWPVELADTAGLRDAVEQLEEAGIARARATLTGADLIVWVQDATLPPTAPDAETAKALVGRPILRILNKIDLPTARPFGEYQADRSVSAVTVAGISELAAQIAQTLVPDPPSAGAAVPFPPELGTRLIEARGLIDSDPTRALRIVLGLLNEPCD